MVRNIYVSLTAKDINDAKAKRAEIRKFNIDTFSFFPTRLEAHQRREIYDEFEIMDVKWIPLVHLRHDMTKYEIKYLWDRFGTRHFTIHEDHFKNLNNWKGYYNHLYLEMNYDNYLAKEVNVKKVGGFCIDLSHFKSEEERWTKEFEYVLHERRIKREFACNHLNGYNPYKLRDKHTVTDLHDFDYLSTLPNFVLGPIIALEVENSIKDQLVFKKHVENMFADSKI